MMRFARTAAVAGLVALACAPAFAQEPPKGESKDQKPASGVEVSAHGMVPERQPWSFAGVFGKYDRAQLQRGFQVFREVCSNCHSAKFFVFRNLSQPGGPEFSEAQVKALAAEYKIKDGPNDAGEMFERPGRPSDHFPWMFANEQAARSTLGGALPPDMSVLAKARAIPRGFPWFIIDGLPGMTYQEQGPDYIYAILNGYDDPPAGVTIPDGLNYNHAMPGNKIAMAKPLNDGQVDYADKTPGTTQQYARDVAAFLMWMAEPKLEARKRMGFNVLVFLAVFATLLYFTKKKVWADVAH